MGSPATWYGAWTLMLVQARKQNRIGRLRLSPRAGLRLGVDERDLDRFLDLLDGADRIADLERAGDHSRSFRIVNWRRWQPLTPAEKSWAKRERDAGRPDPSSPDSVTVAEVDGSESAESSPDSVTKSPNRHHKRRDKKRSLLPSSSGPQGARVREAVDVLSRVIEMDDDARDLIETQISARLLRDEVPVAAAVAAADAFVARRGRGWRPDADDGGIGYYLGMIASFAHRTGPREVGEYDAESAWADLGEYLDRFSGGSDAS